MTQPFKRFASTSTQGAATLRLDADGQYKPEGEWTRAHTGRNKGEPVYHTTLSPAGCRHNTNTTTRSHL